MKTEQKLNVTFHNPNSEEATVEFLTDFFAKLMVARVRKEQQELFDCEKKAEICHASA